MKSTQIFLTGLAISLPVYGHASGILDAASALRLHGHEAYVVKSVPAGSDSDYHPENDSQWYPSILRLEPGTTTDDLVGEYGIKVINRREDLVLALIPRQSAVLLVAGREVASMSVGRACSMTLDRAADWFGANTIREGLTGERLPYTGQGVVAGMCDIGIDPLHLTFGDFRKGENRMAQVSHYSEQEGEWIIMHSVDEYIQWQTDTHNEWHGTHVGGILGGDGAGTPYIGMAPGVTLAASASQLSDVGLLAGAEDILAYAKSIGSPCVINLSMGNDIGPHDGTSLFSQYLDLIAREAVVCISAGNSGSLPITLSFDIGRGCPPVSTRLVNVSGDQYKIKGYTDIWSADDVPLKLRLGVYDGDSGSPVSWTEWLDLSEGVWKCDFKDMAFSTYFNGVIMSAGGVDVENGRYNAALSYDYEAPETSIRGPWARYTLLLEVGDEDGNVRRVDMFSDGMSRFKAPPGQPVPNPDFSISDLCTGHNVVSVGMYNNRSSIPMLSGGVADTGFEAGTICHHSSYGTLADGRVLPLTVAPGAPLVSACNGEWGRNWPDEAAAETSALTDGNTWWISSTGTSMSSPYVAGIIACWLEANPALTSWEIQEIIRRTNRNDVPDVSNPRHGNGWFDPQAGLLEALRLAGLDFPGGTESQLNLSFSNGKLTAVNTTGTPARLIVSDMQGRIVMESDCADGIGKFDIVHLPSGVYAAVLNSCKGRSGIKFKL